MFSLKNSSSVHEDEQHILLDNEPKWRVFHIACHPLKVLLRSKILIKPGFIAVLLKPYRDNFFSVLHV